MAQAPRFDINVNCIARQKGTGKVDPVFYHKNAPKNQPFQLAKKDKAGK